MQLRIRSLWARTLHLVEHALAVTLGLALVLVGLALTFSIVFVVPGIIVLSLGVAIVVGGVFATRSPAGVAPEAWDAVWVERSDSVGRRERSPMRRGFLVDSYHRPIDPRPTPPV